MTCEEYLSNMKPGYIVDGGSEEHLVMHELSQRAFEKAYNGLQGWVDCFEKASLKGMVGGGGIDAANIAASHVDVMKKAYELGKKL